MIGREQIVAILEEQGQILEKEYNRHHNEGNCVRTEFASGQRAGLEYAVGVITLLDILSAADGNIHTLAELERQIEINF
jgi:hypothetical protein